MRCRHILLFFVYSILVLFSGCTSNRGDGQLHSAYSFTPPAATTSLPSTDTKSPALQPITPVLPLTTPAFPPAVHIYHNQDFGFELRYPPDFRVGMDCPTEGLFVNPTVALRLVDDATYTGTNLFDACVTVKAQQIEGTSLSCVNPENPQEKQLGEVSINNLLFSIYTSSDVGLGHIYDLTYYRATHADTCYEVTLFLHYANPGVYAPGTIIEFDREDVVNKLQQVLQSFTLKHG